MKEQALHSPHPPAGSVGPVRPARQGLGFGMLSRELQFTSEATCSGSPVGSYDLPLRPVVPSTGAGEGQEVPRPHPFSREHAVLFSSQKLLPLREELELPRGCLHFGGGCAVDSPVGRICLEHRLCRGPFEVQPPSCPAHSSGASPPDPLAYSMGKLSQQNILRL